MIRTLKIPPALPILLALLLTAGCATTMGTPSNVSDVTCGAGTIEWEVAKEANVSNFSCELGKFGMDQSLIFKMDLTNVSDAPLRYRVNIFLEDMDKAAGHLVPRKGSPPEIAPGETESIEIPFMKTETLSDDVLVVVKAMSP